MKLTNEIKAGIVVLVAIVIAVFFFGRTVTLYKSTYTIKTVFNYAGDLKTDAVVKLSGIEVGRLTAINFVYEPETLVECVMEVDSTAKVRKDSIAYIATSGIVGDSYIGLTPGTSGEFIPHGETVASEDPVQMRLLMKKADQITENLDTILADVKTIVSDNKENVDSIIKNIEMTTENFEEFSADIKAHPWKLLFKGK